MTKPEQHPPHHPPAQKTGAAYSNAATEGNTTSHYEDHLPNWHYKVSRRLDSRIEWEENLLVLWRRMQALLRCRNSADDCTVFGWHSPRPPVLLSIGSFSIQNPKFNSYSFPSSRRVLRNINDCQMKPSFRTPR